MKAISKVILIFSSGLLVLTTGTEIALAQTRKTLNDARPALEEIIPESGITEGNLDTSAATVVKAILGAMGLVFFGLMVYSGVVWMIARGEEDRISKARDTIIAATIGLVIVVSAYAITTLVVNKIFRGL